MRFSTIFAGIACAFSALLISSPMHAQEAESNAGSWFAYGDFNNWTLPTQTDTNGALKFGRSDDYGFEYDDRYILKTDKLNGSSFKLVYVTDYGTNIWGTDYPPFTIYRSQYGVTDSPSFSIEQVPYGSQYKDKDITILNPGSYTIEFVLYDELNLLDIRDVIDAPILELPKTIYAVTQVDDAEPKISEYDSIGYVNIFPENKAHKVSVFFTTENSLTPATENIWGVNANTKLECATTLVSGNYQLVKGGDPLVLEFSGEYGGGLNVAAYPTSGIISATMYRYSLNGDLYLVGYQDGWVGPNLANADKLIKLEETDFGIFEADVDCPYQEPYDNGEPTMQFRFFNGLEGWTDTYSLGASMPDFACLPVDMAEGELTYYIYTKGLGNWGLVNWDGGTIHFKVDMNRYELTITPKTNAVEEVETADEQQPAVYYNLQGVRVENPANGIFIKVQGGKSQKLHLH